MSFDWISEVDLFLFDFDGLLVDTEPLHFAAYLKMCQDRGFKVEWSIEEFFEVAHFEATGIRDALYAMFPDLKRQEPRWEVLYEEKKRAYLELLQRGDLRLLPGVEELLNLLHAADKRRVVVTHSPIEQIELIKRRVPALQTIPHWITRQDYVKPKPDPECYRKAIALFGKEGDRTLGFEDSMRGLNALLDAGAEGVLICPASHPQLKTQKIPFFESFLGIENLDKEKTLRRSGLPG